MGLGLPRGRLALAAVIGMASSQSLPSVCPSVHVGKHVPAIAARSFVDVRTHTARTHRTHARTHHLGPLPCADPVLCPVCSGQNRLTSIRPPFWLLSADVVSISVGGGRLDPMLQFFFLFFSLSFFLSFFVSFFLRSPLLGRPCLSFFRPVLVVLPDPATVIAVIVVVVVVVPGPSSAFEEEWEGGRISSSRSRASAPASDWPPNWPMSRVRACVRALLMCNTLQLRCVFPLFLLFRWLAGWCTRSTAGRGNPDPVAVSKSMASQPASQHQRRLGEYAATSSTGTL